MNEDLADVDPGCDHLAARALLESRGWTLAGEGDWAVTLRSPDGATAARISPFDPAAPYAAELYRRGAATGVLPRLVAHRPLEGGADLLAMELLEPVDPALAAAFHRRIAARDGAIAQAVALIHEVHARGRAEVPFWGPIDDNPANVMRAADGALRVTDLYSADGPRLYGSILEDPMLVARAIPAARRRHLLELPMASSGPWDERTRTAMALALDRADARLAGSGA